MSASLSLTKTVEKSRSNSACIVIEALRDIDHDQPSRTIVPSLFWMLCILTLLINGVLSGGVQIVMLNLLMCIPGAAELTSQCVLPPRSCAWLVDHPDWHV